MKKFEQLLQKRWAAYTMATCSAVVLFLLLSNLGALKSAFSSVWGLISPIFTGIIIAYLFNPVSNFFERTVFKKIKKDSARHIWAVFLTIVCIVLLLAILLLALIPSLAQSISKIIKNWGNYTKKLESVVAWVSDLAARFNIKADFSGFENLVNNGMNRLFTFVKSNYKTIFNTLGNVGKELSNFGIGVIFGFCFLLAKRGIITFFTKVRSAISPQEKIARRNELWSRCHTIFIRYIGSTLLDALIVGVATLIFTLVAGMPYAPLIAVVVTLTNIIPTIGPLIGNIIGVFFIVLESPVKALIFFIFICVLQSVDGMIIKTKLFSGSLGIPGAWSMVLIILGGQIAGMAGILLSIPFAAIAVILYQETLLPRLNKRVQKINANTKEQEPPEQQE